MGDPAGIGPEICLKLLADQDLARVAVPVVLGSQRILERCSKSLNIPFKGPILAPGDEKLRLPSAPSVLDVAPEWGSGVVPGRISSEAGRAAYRYVEYAVRGTLDKTFSACVTAPIHKKSLREAGMDFSGHTEILAALTQSPEVCLMLWSSRMAVSMVTLHVSMEEVGPLLTQDRIRSVIRLTHQALRRLGCEKPRLCVLGYNPHAGDEGLFGDEEIREIYPAVAGARQEGMDVTGPVSPDVAFTDKSRTRFDAFVAMYHDQGHIPFKMLSFDDGVNWTLGVPIIRTSVDHGTAFDMVGQGVASPNSLLAAAHLAARLSLTAKTPRTPREPKSTT